MPDQRLHHLSGSSGERSPHQWAYIAEGTAVFAGEKRGDMIQRLQDNPSMASSSLWQRFQQFFLRYDDVGFSIDISRMRFGDEFFEQMRAASENARSEEHTS